MSRATLTQLRQLGLDSYALDQMADADKQVGLNAGSAQVDTALSSQCDIENIIAPYPMDIIEAECVMASWTLLMVRGYNAPTGIDTNISTRYKYWRDQMDGWSRGENVPLVKTSTDGADAGVTGPSVITSSQRGYSERGTNFNGPFSSD